MTKIKLPLAQAENLAQRIVETLGAGCQEIAIAGSVRRQKDWVGDIEIVAIPDYHHDLLGMPIMGTGSKLDFLMGEMIANHRIKRGERWGPKFRQFHIPALPELTVDLFLVIRETWGVQMMIRTGSAAFSKKAVTPRRKGGYLADDCRVEMGRIWQNGQVLDTDNERDVFQYLSCGWVEPVDRS